MTDSEINCPKCKNAMEEGFEIGGFGPIVDKWIGGQPEHGWLGLGLKVGGRKSLPIAIYRCSSCGYLERYAR